MSPNPAARPERERAFHPLPIAAVRREAADTVSLVLAVPPALADMFAYRAGQYLSLRRPGEPDARARPYSLSSAPELDRELRVTVKRAGDGAFSCWATGQARAGDVVEAAAPAGRFCLPAGDGPVLLVAAGIGITPVLSLAKAALAGKRPVTLLHADRDRSRLAFADELDALGECFGARLRRIEWLSAERGRLDAHALLALDLPFAAADLFVCGPAPFAALVERVARDAGTGPGRIHAERFSAEPAPEEAAPPSASVVAITLNGVRHLLQPLADETVVQTAYRCGVRPPVSCLAGQCATCLARVARGSVRMIANDVLTPAEVAAGFTLACQSVPTSAEVELVFE